MLKFADRSNVSILLVEIAGQKIAFETENIREILDFVPMRRLPGARTNIGNIVNIRGSIVPVVDFETILGLGKVKDGVKKRMLLIDFRQDDKTIQLVAKADIVIGVRDIETSALAPLSKDNHNWPHEFIRAFYSDDEHFVLIPNLERLIQSTNESRTLIAS